MRRAKITIIGGGNVGASCALWAASKQLGDIVVLDIPEVADKVKGRMLDLAQCGPVERFDADVIGTDDYADTAGSDVVVVTAGIHWDNLDPEGIRRIIQNSEILVEMILQQCVTEFSDIKK